MTKNDPKARRRHTGGAGSTRTVALIGKYHSPEIAESLVAMAHALSVRGVRVVIETVEFWQGGEHRLHDRFYYSREGDGWHIERLAP